MNNYLSFDIFTGTIPTPNMEEPLSLLSNDGRENDTDSLINAAKAVANYIVENQGYILVTRSVPVLDAECKPTHIIYGSYIVYSQEQNHGGTTTFYKDNLLDPLLILREGKSFPKQAINFYYTDREYDVETLIAQTLLKHVLSSNKLDNAKPEDLKKITDFVNKQFEKQK